MDSRELDLLTARCITKGIIASFILITVGITQIVRYEANDRYMLFVLGGIASILVLVGLPIYATEDKQSPNNQMPLIGRFFRAVGKIPFIGFWPYILGCYLVFYEGFWGLKLLWGQLSVGKALVPVCYILLGWAIVASISDVSELITRDH